VKTLIVATASALFLIQAHSAISASIGPDDDPDVEASNPFVDVTATQQSPSSGTTDTTPSTWSSPWDFRQVESSCGSNSAGGYCIAYECADPSEVGYILERRRSGTDEPWTPVGRTCVAPDGPVVTPGMILSEVRRIGLPSMSVEVPPETLVNYDTVVYTDAETFTRTVTLLGFTVDVEASPSQFHWTYDDGTTETTTTGGRPYPAKDITHTWEDAHRTFHPSVDVTYQIRFRVDGGGWQTLVDTITIDGPEGNVRIREATGMLADMN
jgi:hypothetical protein